MYQKKLATNYESSWNTFKGSKISKFQQADGWNPAITTWDEWNLTGTSGIIYINRWVSTDLRTINHNALFRHPRKKTPHFASIASAKVSCTCASWEIFDGEVFLRQPAGSRSKISQNPKNSLLVVAELKITWTGLYCKQLVGGNSRLSLPPKKSFLQLILIEKQARFSHVFLRKSKLFLQP